MTLMVLRDLLTEVLTHMEEAMSDDDHDDTCEAEYIFPPGGWTDCACWDRMAHGIKRLEEKP